MSRPDDWPTGPAIFLVLLVLSAVAYGLGILHPLDWWGSGSWR